MNAATHASSNAQSGRRQATRGREATRHFRKLAGYLSKPELKERLRTDTSWHKTPAPAAPAAVTTTERVVLRLVQPAEFVTVLP